MPTEADLRIMDRRPVSFSREFILRNTPDDLKLKELEREAWKYVHKLDESMTGLSSDGRWDADLIPDGPDWAGGVLSVGEATFRAAKGSYWRGLLRRDVASKSINAEKTLRGRENLTGMGKLSEEKIAHLMGFVGNYNNWTVPVHHQFDPGAGLGLGLDLYDSPEKLWERKMPGYSTDKMLKELEEQDFQQYAFLVSRYGSREALMETVGETNNPDHFFYRLNNDLEMQSIQRSLSHHMENMGGLEEFWKITAWPFLRDGLLNDPDMPASLALTIATAGLGGVVGAGSIGLKLFSAGKKMKAFSNALELSKVANLGAKYGTKIAKVSNWLPENIASTLAKKFWSGYPKKGFMKHAAIDPVLNFTEGMIEGSGAEFLNQTFKIRLDEMEAYSVGDMWDEALMEGAFNIVANPLLGSLMTGISNVAINLPMRSIIGKDGKVLIDKLSFNARVRGALTEAIKNPPEGHSRLMQAFEVFDQAEEVANTINGILGENLVDPNNLGDNRVLSAILEPLSELLQTEANDHSFVMKINKLLVDIKNRAEGTLTPEGLIDAISTEIVAQNKELQNPVHEMGMYAKFKVAALRYFREQNIDIEDAFDTVEMTPDVIVGILKKNPEIAKQIQTIVGNEEMSPEKLLETLKTAEIKTYQDLRNQFSKTFQAVQDIARKFQAKWGDKPKVPAAPVSASEGDLLKSKKKATRVFKDSKKKIQKLLKEDPEKRATEDHKAKAGTEIWRAAKRLKEQQEFFTEEQKQELEALVQELKDQNPDIIIEDPTGQGFDTGRSDVDVIMREEPISIQEGLDRGLITQEEVDNQRRNNQKEATSRKKEVEPDDFELIVISRVDKPLVRDKDNGKRIQNAGVRLQVINDIPDTRETPLPTETPPAIPTDESMEGNIESLDEKITAKQEEINEKIEVTTDPSEKAKLKTSVKELEGLKDKLAETKEDYTKDTKTDDPKLKELEERLTEKEEEAEKLSEEFEAYSEEKNHTKLVKLRTKILDINKNTLGPDDGTTPPKHIDVNEAVKAVLKEAEELGLISTKISEKLQSKDKILRKDLLKITKSINETIRKDGEDWAKGEVVEVLRNETTDLKTDVAYERHRIRRERAEELGIGELQVTTITEALRIRQEETRRLEARIVGFNNRVEAEGLETISKRELAIYMPPGESRVELKKDPDDQLSIEAAKTILKETIEKETKRISRLSPGWFVGLDPTLFKNNPEILSEMNIGSVRNAPVVDRSNLEAMNKTKAGRKGEEVVDEIEAKERRVAEDALRDTLMEIEDLEGKIAAAEGDNRGGRITKWQNKINALQETVDSIERKADAVIEEIQTRQEELDVLSDFYQHLASIQRGPWGKEDSVPIFEIDSALAHAGMGSLYDVNVITWFREAIRDLEGNEIDSRLTGEDLLYQYDALTVDLNVLLQQVARVIATSDKDIAHLIDADLKTILKDLRDPSKRGSKHGLLKALALVNRLGLATKAVNISLYKNNGFCMDWDIETNDHNLNTTTRNTIGEDITSEEHQEEFLGGVRNGLNLRIQVLVLNENGYRRGAIWNYLKETFGFDEVTEFDTMSDTILTALETEDYGITKEDLIKMGNGELSYQPANKLGSQVIDFLLTREGLRPLENQTKRDFRESEVTEATEDLSNIRGEHTRVLPYLLGELNQVAPESIADIALILEDDLLRTRIQFVTSLKLVDEKTGELTEEYHQLQKEWDDMVDSGIELSDEPRAISVKLEPGIRLRPHIQQAQMGGNFLTMDETEDILVDMLMNHAQTGYYYIHDNRYTSGKFSMMYKDSVYGGTVDEYLTLGDPTVVPMSNIGSVLALAQMNPYLAPLPDRVIERGIKLEREWHQQGIEDGRWDVEDGPYWENPDFWKDILDYRNQKDRKFNGYFVSKLLGLTSEEAKSALDRLVDDILQQFVPDMYIRTGMEAWRIAGDSGKTHMFGPLQEVFRYLNENGINSEEDYDRLMDTEDEASADLRQKAEALRVFLKNPVMTKLYSAGFPSFKKYWSENGPGMEPGGEWDILEEAGIVTPDMRKIAKEGIPEFLYDIGMLFHNTQFGQISGLLNAAMSLEKYKKIALEVLKMDERHVEGAYDVWAGRVEAMAGEKLDKNHKLKRLETLRKQMEYNILRMAQRQNMDPEEFRKQYQEKLDKVEVIFERAEKQGRDLSKDENDEILSILTPHRAWKENLYFYALNLMNSSGYQMAIDAMKLQAEMMGFEFDENWFMGLQDYILYQTYLPGQNSHRTYAAEASMERHHHTVKWGKIMSDPEKAKEFNKVLRDNPELISNPDKLMEAIWEWVEEQEGESPLGVWQATDNVEFIGDPAAMTVEELQAREQKLRNKVKALLLQDTLMGLAMFDSLPIESYMAEENQLKLEEEQARRWAGYSRRRGAEHKARKRNKALRNSDRVLGQAKVGVLAHPDGRTAVSERGNVEKSASEAMTKDGKTIFRRTDNPKGVFAWQPKMEQTPYLSLGNLELQRRLYEHQREQVFGPLEALEQDLHLAKRQEEQGSIIPPEHRNHSKPWDKESLPATFPIDISLLENLAGLHVHPARRESAMMELELRKWLRDQGREHLLDPNHEEFNKDNIPYLYLTMKADAFLERDLPNITRALTRGVHGTAREEASFRARLGHGSNMWHLGLSEMMELSRNILYKIMDGLSLETKGHQIGIVHPDLRNKTVVKILTSIFDPINNVTGHMMSPTLLHKALGIGMVLGEGIVIQEGINRGEGIRQKKGKTDIWPLIVQNHDFNTYLSAILWDSYIWKAIRKFNTQNDNKYSHINTVDDWNSLHPEDRQEIIDLAREIGTDLYNPLVEFEFFVEETDDDNIVRLVSKDKQAKGVGKPEVFRHAFGGAFSMLVQANRVIQGANIKMALTAEGALMMLSSNTNYPLLRRLELAYHANKRLGVRKDESGNIVPVESESQVLENEFGFNMRAEVERRMLESDSMKLMLARIQGKPFSRNLDEGLETLTDGTRIIGREHPTVVDWTQYRTDEMGRTYSVDSVLTTLRSVRNKLIVTGVGDVGHIDPDFDVLPMIDRVLANVEYHNLENSDTQIAMMMALLLRDPDLDSESMAIFFGLVKEGISDAELEMKLLKVRENYQTARNNYRKIQRLAQLPEAEMFNKFYWDARLFMERIVAGTIPLAADSDLSIEFALVLAKKQKEADLTSDEIQQAKLALAAATKDQAQEAPPILTDVPSEGVNTRTHDLFSKQYPELKQISEKINDAFPENSLQARMLRSVVARVFQIQPSIIVNLDFTLEDMRSFLKKHGDNGLGFAEKTKEDKYELGLAVDKDLPAARLAYILAHEFAHVGMTKFIQYGGREWKEWRRLYLSKTGRSLLKKVVLAARGGVWSPEAQKEYEYYLDKTDSKGDPDPTEFIAAITGYYILNDSLPLVSDLTAKEAELYERSEGLMKRVLNYIFKMMSRLSTVFNSFKSEAPQEFKALQRLIYRTMGHGVDENLVNNLPTGPMYMTTEPKEAPKESTIAGISKELDSYKIEEQEKANRIMKLENQIEEPVPGELGKLQKEQAEILQKIDELETQMEELGGNQLDPWGLSLSQYVKLKESVKNKYSSEGEIDIAKVINEASRMEIRALASLITREMRNIYMGKDGEFGILADSAMDNLPFFDDKRTKGTKLLASGQLSSTGANFTWNSPFQLIVWLSNLVDNSLSTLPGHWGNLDGLPSVVSALGEVQQISTEIGNLEMAIERRIVGFIETHLAISDIIPDEKNIKIKDRIGLQILKKIDGTITKFTDDALIKDPELAELADAIVENYKGMMEILEHVSMENGGRVLSNVTSIVPYRFATGLFSTGRATAEDQTNFTESFRKEVRDKILHQTDRIDPFAAYVAGILPTVSPENTKEGLEELKRIEILYPGVYSELLIYAEKHRRQEENPNKDPRELFAELRDDKDGTQGRAKERLMKKDSEYYESFVIPAVYDLLNLMGSLNEETGTRLFFQVHDNADFTTAYDTVLGELTGRQQTRLAHITSKNSRISDSLLSKNTNPHFPVEVQQVMDVHLRNIIDGAGVNAHFPKLWSIPQVTEVMDIPEIAKFLVWSPDKLADGIMRSVGQDTMLQSMFSKTFGITANNSRHTPAHLVIQLFKKALNDTAHPILANDDGTLISITDRKNLDTSLDTLEEKLDVVLGRASSKIDGADSWMNFLGKYSPDIVRIIYGTNLTMATMIVENMMNVMDNIFGRRSLSGVMESVLALPRRLSPEVRKTVARDQSEILRAFSQGFVPDFSTPSSDIRKSFGAKAIKWLGERNMHLAGHIHEMIATSRAIIFRNWIRDNLDNKKLNEVAKVIKDIKPTDRKKLKAVMKRVGIATPDTALLSYLVTEGIFSDPNKLKMLKELVDIKPNGTYHLGEMILHTNTNELIDGHMRDKMKLIQALKRAERRFIEEVLVNPNPFDSYTGNGSWDTMIEIFRRYPVLFASQQIYRKMARFSPSRMVFNLISYAILDMIYMSSLMLAVGHSLEDLREKWAKEPTKTLLMSMARLPHLGRYLGMVSEMVSIIVGWGYGSGTMQVIPFGATLGYGGNAWKIAEQGFDSKKDIEPHRVINALRAFVPAEMRIVLYQILGEDYMRQSKGTGKSINHMGTQAATSNVADERYLLREILNEVGILDSNRSSQDIWHQLPYDMQESFLEQRRAALEPKESPTPPEKQSPQTSPPAPSGQARSTDLVAAIEEQPVKLAMPEGLA